jgi:hypothetical protein
MPIAVGRKVVFRAAAERELARLYQNIKEMSQGPIVPINSIRRNTDWDFG